jgi:uncharacterized protein (DUF1684 family)
MGAYEEGIETIRKQRDQNTKSNPLSWLNLAGLFWLEEGENSFGSDPANKIALSEFPHPLCGKFIFRNGTVAFHPAPNVIFTCNRPDAIGRPLISDIEKEPDLITIGSITMKIIIRGAITLVRAWDQKSPAGKQFTGFKYYPVNEAYRVKAKYIQYDPPKIVERIDIIGTKTQGQYLGRVEFMMHGAACSMEAEKSDDKILFHFTDATSKLTTYGGGRKFSLSLPSGDEIILDFNLTENWPCAYTPFATCPVVPPENRLAIKVEAGELNYFDH